MENYVPVKLPSGCKVYEDVDPAGISIRSLKGRDEKLIAEMTSVAADKKLNAVLKNILKGIAPEKLTLGDRKFVLLWLIINSYGPTYYEYVVCESCFSRSQIKFDLSAMEVRDLDKKFVQPHEIKLSDGKIVKVRLQTAKDDMKVADYEKKSGSSWIYRYALTLVEEGQSVADKINFLEDLPVGDLAKIRAFHEEFDHGPTMLAPYTCPQCDFESEVMLPFSLEMFFKYGASLKRFVNPSV